MCSSDLFPSHDTFPSLSICDLSELTRSSIASSVPSPSIIVVVSLVTVTVRALPNHDESNLVNVIPLSGDTTVEEVHHEELSLLFMEQLNKEFDGKLGLAIQVFKGEYHRKFMLQLISSQLDMDRMDYLKRDSFYSGVAEGNINSERLIQMMNVQDDYLVIEEKGIYSVEKFLVACRLMYWQAYLHKTSVVAELILTKILKLPKHLVCMCSYNFSKTAIIIADSDKPIKFEFIGPPGRNRTHI